MGIRFFKTTVLGISIFLLVVLGCDNSGPVKNDSYLIRIDETVVTGEEYLDALEIMKAAYPYEALQDPQVINTLKTRLLKQMTEELILSRRARDLGLSVSEAEMKAAIDSIKQDYPDDVFEKTLREKAIPFDVWKKRVAIRLLSEKVIDRELVVQISLDPEEVQKAYRKYYSSDDNTKDRKETIEPAFVKQLRREKAQALYPQWIDSLQQQYDIKLNEQRWKNLFK